VTAVIDTRTAPYAALLLRVALGAMFIAHALLKYYVFTLPGSAQFFQSLGLPGALGGWEYPAFLTAAAAVQALLGDGRFALANLFNTRTLQGEYA
jgi:putative oxidoreductase